ncbi:MAG TPA: DMT family transporter [Steroidobacteraceae bacterium]|nr:DMT family transporter [Steroidobacteraceae bacterium]
MTAATTHATPRGVFLSGLALAAVASTLFSAKAVVVKLAYRHGVDPVTLLALRMLFAAPFFAIALVWSSRGRTPLSGRDHARLVLMGVVGYYGASYLDFLGLQHVSAALERLILYLYPTIVVLMSVLFLRRRFTRNDGWAMLLAYGGILSAFWHDLTVGRGNVLLGAALIFGSALTYALYLVMGGELVHRLGAIRLTAYAILVSTAAVLAQFLLLNPLDSLVQPAPVYWLSAVNGLFCTVIPAFATMLAVERIGAGRAAMVAMLGPVATIVLAWLLLGEAASAWGLAGTALVLAGVLLLSRSPAREPQAGR